MGIAPIHVLQDDEGGYSLPYPLFWIHYKSSRDALAKYRVFNDNNDISGNPFLFLPSNDGSNSGDRDPKLDS